jgi:hypothetical protein
VIVPLINGLQFGLAVAIATVTGLWQLFLAGVNLVMAGLNILYQAVILPIARGLQVVLGAAIDFVAAGWERLQGAVDRARNVLAGIYNDYILPVGRFLRDVFNQAVENAGLAWETFKDGVDGVVGFLSDIKDTAEGLIETIGNLIDKLSDIPGGGLVEKGLSFLDGGSVALPQGGSVSLPSRASRPPSSLTAALARRGGRPPIGSAATARRAAATRQSTYNDNRTINLNSVDGLGEADIKRLNRRLAVAAGR